MSGYRDRYSKRAVPHRPAANRAQPSLFVPKVRKRHASLSLQFNQSQKFCPALAAPAQNGKLGPPLVLASTRARRAPVYGAAILVEQFERRVRDPRWFIVVGDLIFAFDIQFVGQVERSFMKMPRPTMIEGMAMRPNASAGRHGLTQNVLAQLIPPKLGGCVILHFDGPKTNAKRMIALNMPL